MRSPTLAGFSLALACSLSLASLAHAAPQSASQTAPHLAPQPSRDADRSPARKPLSAKDRAPTPSSLDHLRDHHHSDVQRKSSAKEGSATLAACDTSIFTRNTGWALVDAIRTSTMDCVNETFGFTGSNARSAFSEAQMRSVADGLRSYASSYAGNNSQGAANLVLYLRAGYYVQYYNSADVGSYGAGLKTSLQGALDTLFNNATIFQNSNANGETLSEAVILIDSSVQNARYLWVVRRLLNDYTTAWNASWNMRNAANNAFTVLFRGHQEADFQQAVQSDSSTVYALSDFASRNWNLLGTDNAFLTKNASRELSRFLQYASLKPTVRPLVQGLATRSSLNTPSGGIWVGLADMTDYYDAGNCSYYSNCNWKARTEAAILPLRQTCSPSLTLRAQSMTAAEQNSTCTSVVNQESYFHAKLQTNRQPVANDFNSSLELVVFDSPADYEDYGGALFGMDTNNGGMYLEGNPAAAGNQARFVAYEADWMRPSFQVWNLNHEYTHYLDGRFDMYGDFSANMSTPTVWWSEGLAEHVAYCYLNQRYDDALSMAGSYTYTLNQLFDTDYGNQDRVYRWGYLAVSFMMERHRADVSTLLGFYRKGDWTGARSFLKSTIGSRYDSEFRSWLGTVNTNGVNCANGTPPANVAPTAGFSFSTSGLSANFTDTSTDPDGSVASWAWNFGDGSSSTVKNPSKTYAQAGTYTVTLTVKDNSGASSNPPKTQQVTVSAVANKPPVANFSCTASGLTLTCTDSSTDADGTVASWAWTFGDGSSSTAKNPSKTFAAAGTYTVTLTVKDNAGASSNPPKSQSFTVSTSTPNLCPGRSDQMSNGCVRTGLAGAAGDLRYYYIYVDKPNVQLSIQTSGGSGNADLYVNTQGWASPSSHNYRSTNSGNAESVVVPVYTPGYVYLTVSGKTAFSGLSLSTRY